MKRVILVAMVIAMPCSGVQYEWPYVARVDIELTSSTTAQYTLHMAKTVINDDSIGDGASVKTVMQAKGKYAETNSWGWGNYHRHKNGSGYLAAINMNATGPMNDKWTTVARDLAAKYGAGKLYIAHEGQENGGECIGTGIWGGNARTSWTWDDWPSNFWNGGVSGGCLGTPQPDQWCALKTPTVEIAYGTMTLKDADGSTKNAGVQVECTTGMKYTLRLQDANNETTLDNGGRVTWQAGGKAVGETLTGEAGENSVDLTATLHGPFERTGEFHGSGILFVSYP